MIYMIWNPTEKLWWSNENGWVDIVGDIFTEAEKNKYNLPIGGVWYNIVTQVFE